MRVKRKIQRFAIDLIDIAKTFASPVAFKLFWALFALLRVTFLLFSRARI